MDASGHEETTISENSSNDFQLDLIPFALQAEHLLFLHNVDCWREFYSTSQINAEKYWEKTPEELRECFMQQVLPHIYNYDLSNTEVNLLNLLSLHPGYRRTEVGFVKTQAMETINFQRECGLARDSWMLPHNQNLTCQVLISPSGYISNTEKELNKENSHLLSVILCPDIDLPVCQLLSAKDIQKRLREAKTQFERNGQQLGNLNCSIEELLQKLKTVRELKDLIANLVTKNFS